MFEGSNAVCGRQLCCRAESGNLTNPKDAAGYWGDYRDCDMPWRTIENAVAHMAKHHSVIDLLKAAKQSTAFNSKMFYRMLRISYGQVISFHTISGILLERRTS